MNKIVELNSKELNSVSGGIVVTTILICGAVVITGVGYFGVARFISDYQNRACDTWQENGWSSKNMCYFQNALTEGATHGFGHLVLDFVAWGLGRVFHGHAHTPGHAHHR